MKDNTGDRVAGRVDEMWVIREQPAGDGNGPDQIGGLRHFHVGSVGGEIHGADAQRDGVRGRVNFLIEDNADCDGVMHAALHEAALLFDGTAHVALRLWGGFLREGARGTTGGNHGDKQETGDHETPHETREGSN